MCKNPEAGARTRCDEFHPKMSSVRRQHSATQHTVHTPGQAGQPSWPCLGPAFCLGLGLGPDSDSGSGSHDAMRCGAIEANRMRRNGGWFGLRLLVARGCPQPKQYYYVHLYLLFLVPVTGPLPYSAAAKKGGSWFATWAQNSKHMASLLPACERLTLKHPASLQG